MFLKGRSKRWILGVLLAWGGWAFALDPIPPQAEHFIHSMGKDYHYNEQELKTIFSQVEYKASIIDIIQRPYEKQPWYLYQQHFLTPSRIQKGVDYWDQHTKELDYAEKHFGVDPSIIVAILGVETHYGEHTGGFRIIDALSTLAFYYPPREKFFLNELKEYLLLTREQHLSPFALQGSYAGAIGIPQFMPSSYRQFATAREQTGAINLNENHEAAILSVANYFKQHHWELHAPVAVPALARELPTESLVSDKKADKEFTLAQFKKAGILPETNNTLPNKAALITLEGQNSPEYWLTFHNFSVIMRYNPSIDYAMAVFQLSQAIKAERNSEQHVPSVGIKPSRPAI